MQRLPVLLLVMVGLHAGGCRTPQVSIASDETFFTPLAAAPQRVAAGRETVALPAPIERHNAKLGSLLKSQREQARRISLLAAQVDSLGGSRRTIRTDTLRAPESGAKILPPAPAVAALQRNTVVDAERLYASGDYANTIQMCGELMKRGIPNKGDEARCNFITGASYYRLKQYDRAVAALKSVLDAKVPIKRADASFLLGLTYKQLGRLDDAAMMYQAALKESPPATLVPSINKELERLKKKR